jgi:hypothetical protein
MRKRFESVIRNLWLSWHFRKSNKLYWSQSNDLDHGFCWIWKTRLNSRNHCELRFISSLCCVERKFHRMWLVVRIKTATVIPTKKSYFPEYYTLKYPINDYIRHLNVTKNLGLHYVARCTFTNYSILWRFSL